MALGCLKRLSMRLSFGLLLPWSLRLSGSWSGSIHLPCLYVLFFFFWNLIRILQFQLAFFHKKEISSLRVCHRLNLSSLLLFSTMHAPFRWSSIATVIRNCGRFLLRSGLSLTFFCAWLGLVAHSAQATLYLRAFFYWDKGGRLIDTAEQIRDVVMWKGLF